MFKKICLSLFLCVLVAVLAWATVAEVRPFVVAFLWALLGTNVIKTLPVLTMVIMEMWRNPQSLALWQVLLVVGVYCLVNWGRTFLAKPQRWDLWFGLGGFVLSHSLQIYLACVRLVNPVLVGLNLIVGVIFYLAAYTCVRAVIQKKFLFPWTIEQIVCLLVVVTVAALGLCGLPVKHFDLHKFVSVVAILMGVFYVHPKATVLLAVALGLGKAFYLTDLLPVAVYVILATSVVVFKSRHRFFALTALVATDLVLGFYFNGYGYYDGWSLLPLGLAMLLFLITPRQITQWFTFGASGLGGFLVSKNTINRNTAGISMRMRSLAMVFNEMQNTYRNLTQEALPPQQTATLLCTQITTNVCGVCPHRGICQKTTVATKEITDSITTLARTGLKKGSCSLLDVPNTLAIKCNRINTLVAQMNKLVVQSQNKAQIVAGLDSGKILMANLLSGISQLCSKFAADVCRTVVFDNERGEMVKEELLYHGIYAEDCLITKNSHHEYVVSVLVPRGDANNNRIEKVVSKVCGHKMIVDEVTDADTKGFAIVAVRSAPRYHVLFGMAGVTKGGNQQSGDNYSFLRVTNEKTLMALCDGMGSGERANRASILALSLVENFYKAGFPDAIIMHSVNQLLTFTGQDVFSALDMCVFDLATGDTDFIKVGAADGFIKRAREVEVVTAGSLPLGILDDIEPKITKAVLLAGDMVILVSDGVLEAFGGERIALAGFLNNLDAVTPQHLADQVIVEVLRRTAQRPPDDCTVTVAQIMKM